MSSPRTGWRWESLRTAGVVEAPSMPSSSTAPAPASAWRSSRAVDAEGHGVLAAAVEHAGDQALAAQTARRARERGLAGVISSWVVWSAMGDRRW